MTINAARGPGNNSQENPTAETQFAKALKPDDFIKLFLTQLKNQNPMQPTDSSTILQQMANISSISASKDIQTTMKEFETNMNVTMGNTQVLAATQLIGKKVLVPWDHGHLVVKGDSGEMAGSVLATGAASQVTVTIKDKDGKVVKSIDLGPCYAAEGGLMDFKWDGKDKDGNLCKDDNYSITAVATSDGKDTKLETAAALEVKSVASTPKDGKLIMNVDVLGGRLLSQIVKIM